MKVRRILFSVAAFAAMLLVWEFAVRSFDFAEYMLPPPSEVAMYLWGAVCDLSLPKAVWVTGKRLFTGYAIGLCVGIPTGILCSRFNIFKDTVGILALGLQALPSVCWVPLAIMWFGQEESAMLFVVVMGTVWSLILATQHGVANIPPIYLRAASTMGSRGLHTWLHVIAPAALGICVEVADGRGNLRDDPHGVRSRTAAALRQGAHENGPGNRRDVRCNSDRAAYRQGGVLAHREQSPQALGHILRLTRRIAAKSRFYILKNFALSPLRGRIFFARRAAVCRPPSIS